jgi:hypothetical protein
MANPRDLSTDPALSAEAAAAEIAAAPREYNRAPRPKVAPGKQLSPAERGKFIDMLRKQTQPIRDMLTK